MIATKALVLALSAGLAALAAAAPTPGPDAQGPPPLKIPSQGSIQIDPSALVMIPPEPPPTIFEQATNAMAGLSKLLEEFKRVRSAYKTALGGCASRSYTVQEMHAAGCSDNDTVAACSRKLLHDCITKARRPAEKVRDATLQELLKVQATVRNAVALPDPPQP